MFHHFPDEPGVGASCLVRSTDLAYQSTGGSGMTTVASAAHTGYRRRPHGGYHAVSLPPLELALQPRRHRPRAPRPQPRGAGEPARRHRRPAYQWVDLDGEGLSGILARQGGAWFYKANLGDGRFAPERDR